MKFLIQSNAIVSKSLSALLCNSSSASNTDINPDCQHKPGHICGLTYMNDNGSLYA